MPTLFSYLGRDPLRTREAVLLGTCFPLAIYSIWELVCSLLQCCVCSVVPHHSVEFLKVVPWAVVCSRSCYYFVARYYL